MNENWQQNMPKNPNYPLVQDFQYLTIISLIFYSQVPIYGIILLFVLAFVAWDGYFWTTILSLPLSILLPIFAVYLLIDTQTLMYIESNGFWRVIKRWCDSTTFLIWFNAHWFNVDLVNDANLPYLLLIQWVLLPVNSLFVGVWTIVLWPLSVVIAYYTWVYYEDVMLSGIIF